MYYHSQKHLTLCFDLLCTLLPYSHVSEQQRAFGRVTSQADMTSKMAFVNQAFDEYKERKGTANKSNVFRLGDYDNISKFLPLKIPLLICFLESVIVLLFRMPSFFFVC